MSPIESLPCSAFVAHIGFEQTQYTSLEAEGSVNICISVYTGPLIESLIVKVDVRSGSATGMYYAVTLTLCT